MKFNDKKLNEKSTAWGVDSFIFEARAIQRLTEIVKANLAELTLSLNITDEDILRFAQGVLEDALKMDIERLVGTDPAVKLAGSHGASYVLESYKGVEAVLHYRVANALIYHPDMLTGKHLPEDSNPNQFLLVAARRISEEAASRTSIEINPAAQIGQGLVIDHGVHTKIGVDQNEGVVVGETCKIGVNCTILNGVVLGARAINSGEEYDRRRHPKLGDDVTVGAGVRILGGITIGDDVTIGPG